MMRLIQKMLGKQKKETPAEKALDTARARASEAIKDMQRDGAREACASMLKHMKTREQ